MVPFTANTTHHHHPAASAMKDDDFPLDRLNIAWNNDVRDHNTMTEAVTQGVWNFESSVRMVKRDETVVIRFVSFPSLSLLPMYSHSPCHVCNCYQWGGCVLLWWNSPSVSVISPNHHNSQHHYQRNTACRVYIHKGSRMCLQQRKICFQVSLSRPNNWLVCFLSHLADKKGRWGLALSSSKCTTDDSRTVFI